MKNIILIFSLFFSFSLFALPKTVIKISEPPSPKQVKLSIEILSEALEEIKKENTDMYERKISKARKFLEERNIQKTFAAEILCDGKNAFDEEASSTCDFFTEGNICYKGEIKTALTLIRQALNYWNWDESWAENPRIKSQKLFIDIVDGPNDLRNTIEIVACN